MAVNQYRAFNTTGVTGAYIDQTGSGDGAARLVDGHGRYVDAVARGNVYYASTAPAGVTIVVTTSVSPLPTGATASPIIGLWNPYNSGYLLFLWYLEIYHVSGTPGAGCFNWNILQQGATPITAGYVTFGINALNGQQGGAGQATVAAAATTGSVAGVKGYNVVQVPFAAGAIAATETVGFSVEYGGRLVVPPGTALALAAAATGTSHVVAASMQWEQVPIGI